MWIVWEAIRRGDGLSLRHVLAQKVKLIRSFTGPHKGQKTKVQDFGGDLEDAFS